MSRGRDVAAGLAVGVASAVSVAAAPTPDLANTDFYADRPVAGLVEATAELVEANHDAHELEMEVDYEGPPSAESAEHRDAAPDSTFAEAYDVTDFDTHSENSADGDEGDADAQAAADALDAEMSDIDVESAGEEADGEWDMDVAAAADAMEAGDLDADVEASEYAGDAGGDAGGDTAGDGGW